MSVNPTATFPLGPLKSGDSTAPLKKINPLLETSGGQGEDHLSFWDVLDIVNPLQHIPIVNNIYRAVTGDKISNFSRIAGGALYGGFIGAAVGMANAVAVNETGDDIGAVAMDKMGLIKSQEIGQGYKAQNAVASADEKSPATDLKNIPMVEVHPAQNKQADASGIIWDQPKSLATIEPTKEIKQMANQEIASVAAETNPVAAMPVQKDLKEMDVASNAASNDAVPTNDPSVSKADVQKNMTEALNKYNAMQTSTAASTGEITNPAVSTNNTNAAPKNIFAMPAGPSVNAADSDVQDVPAVKKKTAAFNKLRHF